MRELKFRAWDVESECYIDETDWAGITPEGQNIWLVEEEEVSVLPILGEFIIEQYTGLKDKNGKKIYEGDIVRYGSNNYEVKFDEMKDSDCTYYYLGWAMGDLSLCELNSAVEIIGNIHENPELVGCEE